MSYSNSPSVCSLLILVLLSCLFLLTDPPTQGIASIFNSGLSHCVSCSPTLQCHAVHVPLLIFYCFVFHTNTHRCGTCGLFSLDMIREKSHIYTSAYYKCDTRGSFTTSVNKTTMAETCYAQVTKRLYNICLLHGLDF